MALYLLHFDQPFGHARHYLGFRGSVEGIESRLAYHRAGRGSRLLAAVAKAGIGWTLARVWPEGDRSAERRKKNRTHAEKCPLCKASRRGLP